MAALLVRAAGMANGKADSKSSLKTFVNKTGYNRALFKSAAAVSRGEVAQMIYLWKTKM